jgi:nitroimidazol reductase NimA-like FMN-containing flavoprotein (pyridoxamine 5'-phosphate oxidase superfamily)
VSTGYTEALEPEECRRLLASRRVARVAFVTGDDVVVLPVSYMLDDRGVLVFSTSSQGLLGRLVEGARVSVQLDDVEEDLQNGWSVLGVGRADRYEGSAVPQAWVPGHDDLRIGVTIETLTGRAVSVGQ